MALSRQQNPQSASPPTSSHCTFIEILAVSGLKAYGTSAIPNNHLIEEQNWQGFYFLKVDDYSNRINQFTKHCHTGQILMHGSPFLILKQQFLTITWKNQMFSLHKYNKSFLRWSTARLISWWICKINCIIHDWPWSKIMHCMSVYRLCVLWASILIHEYTNILLILCNVFWVLMLAWNKINNLLFFQPSQQGEWREKSNFCPPS